MLTQAELVVIDEAAAIPLPIVKGLLGNYLVFMASTVNGYEGTGRSLSMKLVKQLREDSVKGRSSTSNNSTEQSKDTTATVATARGLREIQLSEPIRYAAECPIESWLNKLLCLDCTSTISHLPSTMPHPSQCELYSVTRDTLFSGHPVA